MRGVFSSADAVVAADSGEDGFAFFPLDSGLRTLTTGSSPPNKADDLYRVARLDGGRGVSAARYDAAVQLNRHLAGVELKLGDEVADAGDSSRRPCRTIDGDLRCGYSYVRHTHDVEYFVN